MSKKKQQNIEVNTQKFADRWQDVLKPSLKKEILQLATKAIAISPRANKNKRAIKNKNKKAPIRGRHFCLGGKYKNIYFTSREYQTMTFLLKGFSVQMVAEELGLSKRTIEYFTGGMRGKLNCKTTASLVELVKTTDFEKYEAVLH